MSELSNKIQIKLSTIWNISNKINSTLDLNSLLSVIMEAAKKMLKCEGSALMLMDHEKNELKFDIITGEVSKGESAKVVDSIRVPLGTGVAGITAETEKALIVNDAENDPRVFKKVDEATKFSTRNLACVPMKIKDKLIGVLEVVNSIGRDSFSNHDLIILNFLSDQAAIAINNRQLFDELEKANIELADRVKELTILYEISMASNQSYELEELFQTALKSIKEVLRVERCSIFMHDNENKNLVHYASVGIPELNNNYKVEDTEGIMGLVYQESDPILVVDIQADEKFSKFKKDFYKTNSFLSIPLIVNEDTIGILNISDKENGEVFDSTDYFICTSIGSNLAGAYNTFKLNQEIIKQERLKKEIETAVAIQRRILPKSFENTGDIVIEAFTTPARYVGGDYYDFMLIDEHRFAVLIADVSGKGIPAAIFAALTRNTLRAEANNFVTTDKVFSQANKFICLDSEAGMFVTATIFMINHRDKTIHYSFAGHNEQVFYKPGEQKLELLKNKGIPLGVFNNSTYNENFMHYEKGDILVLFTDGVVEANNDNHEEFGEENFYALVEKYSNLECKEMLEAIKNEIMEFSSKDHLFDDFTLMIIKF